MSECPNLEPNLEDCTCTYPCNLKGKCCECVRNHRSHNELPAYYSLGKSKKPMTDPSENLYPSTKFMIVENYFWNGYSYKFFIDFYGHCTIKNYEVIKRE